MKTLDQIAIHHQTDRASVFTRTYAKAHGYAQHYDRLFSPLRLSQIKLLEIGVGGGEGIRMWLDYFPNAHVVGVDTVMGTNEWNQPNSSPEPRYKFCQGDQGQEVFWKCFTADFPGNWDVVIDDGGHFSNQIITSFDALWPNVRSGGFYAVEDLGVAYGQSSVFVPPGYPNHIDWIFSKINQINIGQSEISHAHFSKELVVFIKQ